MIFVIAVFAVSSLASATLAYMYFWQDRHLAGLIWACIAMVYGHFAIGIAEDWFTKDNSNEDTPDQTLPNDHH